MKLLALDLTGQKFGKLTVTSRDMASLNKKVVWICSCDCGNSISVEARNLTRGTTDWKSCGQGGCSSGRGKRPDRVGQRIGSLLIIARAPNRRHNSAWVCKCDCGVEKTFSAPSLLSVKACGERLCNRQVRDLTGQKFGRWTVDGLSHNDKSGKSFWNCVCECTERGVVFSSSLLNGESQSCGCRFREMTSEHNSDDIAGQVFGKLTAISRCGSSKYDGGAHARWLCLCECGRNKETTATNLKTGHTASCGCTKTALQQEFTDFIASIYPDLKLNDRTVLKPKELDVWIPELNLAFEFDGLYWHSEGQLRNSDRNKQSSYHKYLKCKEKGIRLVTVFEDEWRFNKPGVEGYIRSIFSKKTTVGARKCTVSLGDTKSFIDANHLQGAAAGEGFVLELSGQMVAAATFSKAGKSKSMKIPGDVWELTRYCVTPELSVAGGMSKILHAFLRAHPECSAVVSYSDNRWSIGGVYRAAGFVQENQGTPTYWYVKHGSNAKRIHRFKWRKEMALKAYGGSPDDTEWEIMQRNGWDRIWDCGKSRWVFYPDKQSTRVECPVQPSPGVELK